MVAPQTLVTRFFQLVNQRQFAEAERELQRIKHKMQNNEWNRGYYIALFGIMLSTKTNNDQYLFLQKFNKNDVKTLKAYRKSFLKQVNSRLNADYDRGFFSAWADYTRILLKTLSKVKPQIKPKLQRKQEVTIRDELSRKERQTDIFQFLATTQQRVKENPKNNP